MIVIDAPQEIPETPIFSLTCVDGRQGKGLRGVRSLEMCHVDALFKGVRRFVVWNPCPVRRLQRAVSDFSEVKLMETFTSFKPHHTCIVVSDFSEVKLMETILPKSLCCSDHHWSLRLL